MTLKSICFICNEYPPCANGGIGTFTRELAESLAHRGVRVFAIGTYNGIERDTISEINNVQVVRIKEDKGLLSFISNRYRLYRKTKELVEQKGIQLVEAYDFSGLTCGWGDLGVPLVCRLHGSVHYFYDEMNDNSLKSLFWKAIEGRVLRSVKHIISVSDYTANRTKHLFSLNQTITTIYNGVSEHQVESSEPSFNVDGNKFNVVFAGSVIRKKGVLQLAQAWLKLIKHYPQAHLYIIGKDTESRVSEIRQILSEHFDSLTYLGLMPKEELISAYHVMNLAVFPSYSEAFSLAPMEAMKEGIPVVYTKRASGYELIEDRVDGFLVEPDNIDEIFEVISGAIEMESHLLEEISESGRCKIENKFNFVNTVSVNLNYYESVLRGK